MDPAIVTAVLAGLFVATHVGLALRPVRSRLAGRLGEAGFTALFSVVASVCFAALVHYTALQLGQGSAGPGLGRIALLRWLLLACTVAGFGFIFGSLAVYPRSPMALFSNDVGPVRGIERISRHAFFMGVALFAGSHVLLATRLPAAVFFLGLTALAVLGAVHQDRKLARRLGDPYREYLSQTSTLPFAAILAGRQRLAPGEQPWLPMLAGVVLAFVLRGVHEKIFAAGGAWLIAVVLGGAALATLGSARRQARRRARPRQDALEREKQWTT